jgi:hypothetical protein
MDSGVDKEMDGVSVAMVFFEYKEMGDLMPILGQTPLTNVF